MCQTAKVLGREQSRVKGRWEVCCFIENEERSFRKGDKPEPSRGMGEMHMQGSERKVSQVQEQHTIPELSVCLAIFFFNYQKTSVGGAQ